jgi:hypothetical protein
MRHMPGRKPGIGRTMRTLRHHASPQSTQENTMPLSSINTEQRLYVLRESYGFSCLGFDYADSKARAVAGWLGRDDLTPTAEKGTAEHYAQYLAAMAAGSEHNRRTKQRCDADLIPALKGLEGYRVEVTDPDGRKRRFYVGRSTGWMPCHLEIANRRSFGGGSAYVPDGATVRALYRR